MKNNKLLIFLAIFIVVIFAIILLKTFQANKPNNTGFILQTPAPAENDSPKIISTKPDPLEEAIVSATEVVEITFNKPLENSGEFKLRIEPKIDFKIELSSDRKTAKIIPVKPYELGTTYTLFIGPDTKFDGVGAWGQEKIYHFKTIRYRGV